jgi:hypothetical protein
MQRRQVTGKLAKLGMQFRTAALSRINGSVRTIGIYAIAGWGAPTSINKVMLASLAGSSMFQNRINLFVPLFPAPSINTSLLAAANPQQRATIAPPAVQIADIYHAAKNRAVEDHELDKLFNPDFYGDHI